jgi:hypothetical protein
MSHVYHDMLPGYDGRNVLHDGCPECEERAKDGIEGVLALDDSNVRALWRGMMATRWSGGPGLEEDRRLSRCDSRLYNQLYYVGILMERAGIPPHAVLAGLS